MGRPRTVREDGDRPDRKVETITSRPDGTVIRQVTQPRYSNEMIDENMDETEEQEEKEESPGWSRFREMIGNMNPSDPNRPQAKLYRIMNGKESYAGSLNPDQVDIQNPEEAVKLKFPEGGDFVLRWRNPDGSDDAFPFGVLGTPSKPGETNLFNFLPQPQNQNGQPVSADSSGATIVALGNMVTTLMNQNANQTIETIKALASIQKAPASAAKSELRDTIEILEALDNRKSMKWDRIIEIGKMVLNEVKPLIMAKAGNGEFDWKAGLFQMFAPRADSILDAVSHLIKNPSALKTPSFGPTVMSPTVNVPPAGAVTTGAPVQATGVVAAPSGEVDPNIINSVRQWFKDNVIPDLMSKAEDDLDAYTVVQFLRPQIVHMKAQFEERLNLKFTDDQASNALGLASAAQFYGAYPAAAGFKEWFDEALFYLHNPDAARPEEPEAVEQEEEESLPPEPKPTRKRRGNGVAQEVVG